MLLFLAPSCVQAAVTPHLSLDKALSNANDDPNTFKENVVHRISCGGLQPLVDSQGHVWSQDYGFGNSSTIHRRHGEISGPTLRAPADFDLYEKQRSVQRRLSDPVFGRPCATTQPCRRAYEVMMKSWQARRLLPLACPC